MKSSRFYLLFSVILSLCLFGCTKDDKTFQSETINVIETKVFSSAKNFSKVEVKRFTKEMLSSLIQASPNKGKYSVSIDSRRRFSSESPDLYIVNFEDGGWMLVAGYVRNENQVLAYGDEGSFDPNEITNPGVKFWYDMVQSNLDNLTIEEERDVVPASITPGWIDMNQDYYWVRLPMPSTTDVDEEYVAPLLNTKWGQGYPWNTRTPQPTGPYYNNTGCVAVSCAQILYYLQQTKNFNIGLYENIEGTYSLFPDYAIGNDGYIYYPYYKITNIQRLNYQQNTPRWIGMRQEKNAQGRADWVADLMYDIAEHLGMMFYQDFSASPHPANLFTYYGVACDTASYDFNLVKHSLDSGLPVEVSCFPSSGGIGHSWVIDGYKVHTRITDTPYQWKLIPPDSLCYYNNLNFDYVLTEEEKQSRFPDLEENQIEHNYSCYSDRYLLMNWGYDGENDNNYFSLEPNWTFNNTTFNSHAMIIHNFRQE